MGLELLAHKWKSQAGWNEYIIEHTGLDPIRSYVRYPKPKEAWSFSKRRIYDADFSSIRSDGQPSQMIYECDILATGTEDSSEFYFIVAFFGMEYAINLGGDSMDGYYKWLENHNQRSPLYTGNNDR
ncbi:hypothetical protein [Herbaspirillum huttiense]|uniref:Uncharacterized protein n=1 Tax=Herbaspirillum huttiense subsp. lycopersici TaxID=3074428 RepID=A0ABU2ESJ4_9BURK|nr:hypothetical protein [Herbaspirillum huttiense]MDR9851149.1 hypothetical protein [Herbaspirillum huttiense SE1]